MPYASTVSERTTTRRIRARAVMLGAMMMLVGCASDPAADSRALVTTNATAVPTTAPVGVPIPEPTPTAIVLPEPTATPLTTPLPVPTTTPTPAPPDEPTAPPEPTTAPEPTAPPEPSTAPEPTAPPPEPTAEPEPTAPPEPTAEPEPTPAATAVRVAVRSGYQPLGRAASIDLVLPVDRIELIGFHEAGHPGSTPINAAGTGVPMITLETRNRGTDARSAADIVVPPGEPVVAPVSGTVVASGGYVLYCEHQDQLVYIEPDGLPGWQVRIFHVVGEGPAVGSRVVAGITPIGEGARMFPFESQVDEHSGEPSWPHVHLEVVDTSVPDTRPPGPGCD